MTKQQTTQRRRLSHQIEKLLPTAFRNEQRAAKTSQINDLPESLLETLDTAQLTQLVNACSCSSWFLKTILVVPELILECIREHRFTVSLQVADLYFELSSGVSECTSLAQIKQLIRQIIRREKIIIAWRDLNNLSDLEDNLFHLSQLAEATTSICLDWLALSLTERHGSPVGETNGLPATFCILALGKLGGGELNFHSDIDLIPFHSEQGETDGQKPISNQEFFTQLTRQLVDLLQSQTELGLAYHVDLRLRPFGDSGALTSSHNSMVTYYASHGREWERYALIKARPIAGDLDLGRQLLTDLSPFIYRRYLDYGVFESLRELKQNIDQQIERKSGPYHVKLGPGGIREIEFITQVFQLLSGGRDRRLQQPQILQTLPLLRQREDLTADQLKTLTAGYLFLRRTEHRIQMLNHLQIHTLPTVVEQQQQLAAAMGDNNYKKFLQHLNQVTDGVSTIFNNLLASPETSSENAISNQIAQQWHQTLVTDQVTPLLEKMGFDDPLACYQGLLGLQKSHPLQVASIESAQRVHRLIPKLLDTAVAQQNNCAALIGALRFLQSIIRRSAYISLLIENPQALDQLCRLCAAGDWLTNWLCDHPVLLDELLDHRSLKSRPDYKALALQFQQVINPSQNQPSAAEEVDCPEQDLEQQMNRLRDLRSGSLLRAAILDIGEQTDSAGLLADTAELVLTSCLQMSWQHLINTHGPPAGQQNHSVPKMVVIGYGKLGSQVMSYSSDLDLVLLQPDLDSDKVTEGANPISNHRFYHRVVQRFIHLLTTQTTSGKLYEIDFRLRPSGNSGPIVTQLNSFERYLREDAHTWECQALVHARPVAGDPALKQAFLDLRQQALRRNRDEASLSTDIVQMIDRIRQEKAIKSLPDKLKLSPGGMIDIEFCAQYLVLRHASKFAQLTEPTTTAGILQTAADCKLINQQACDQLIKHYQLLCDTRNKWELGQPIAEDLQSTSQWHSVIKLTQHILLSR
ncbi:MAG: bifunctional [glutamate--ammonia ligase]-adenylyl-L-tyrosine phosphorylase/[glutamate--ammonia-ligase] adenylyltransferase [Immundisolibacteraceae bacterium]|nr:bifunctional [glutamate--ammonia ligase]-adenylyl-L-tyrosine phosphorylase/[glutamate--ammonia-ligase] adenylyltransferase [Immundisolibacteraceae bacterium]